MQVIFIIYQKRTKVQPKRKQKEWSGWEYFVGLDGMMIHHGQQLRFVNGRKQGVFVLLRILEK